jgi:hypothetical protein
MRMMLWFDLIIEDSKAVAPADTSSHHAQMHEHLHFPLTLILMGFLEEEKRRLSSRSTSKIGSSD